MEMCLCVSLEFQIEFKCILLTQLDLLIALLIFHSWFSRFLSLKSLIQFYFFLNLEPLFYINVELLSDNQTRNHYGKYPALLVVFYFVVCFLENLKFDLIDSDILLNWYYQLSLNSKISFFLVLFWVLIQNLQICSGFARFQQPPVPLQQQGCWNYVTFYVLSLLIYASSNVPLCNSVVKLTRGLMILW